MEEIGIVDNSAYAPKAIPMYVALRFLDECGGRWIVEGGEIVEGWREISRNCTSYLLRASPGAHSHGS